ncbi:MAG: SPOR domain-containing protein [Bacteroidia bacterium]
MKKLILSFLFLVSITVRSQTDTSALDKLTPEELLKYYQNEKEPYSTFKGPEGVGDTLYNELNPQVVPTQTVYAESLFRWGSDAFHDRFKLLDSLNNDEQQLKPKISLGAGRMGFYGDLYNKQFQSPLTSRPAFDLNISQRLTRYLQLNFNVMFGQLGANENTATRHENFQSEIRAGGVNLMYDFGNFIPDHYKVRPYVSIGIAGFEFLSKTDLKDKNGNTYYYWSDGSIKDRAEGSADAQNAVDLKRDYVYETDVRERNADGFGKYREAAIAIPVGAGAVFKVTDRIDFKLNFQLFFTNTDYIDGISKNSIGDRKGDKKKDNFSYSSFALQYDLIAKPLGEKEKLHKDTLGDKFWLAMDAEDTDKDGVTDFKDECQGTPEGVKVDEKGCPLDDDKDGIPNYRDDELATAAGMPVNERGVGQTPEYWQAWYNQYMNDSIGDNPKEEIVGNIFALDSKKTNLKNKKDIYTVELARYLGSIPSDELALLLSIGDIKSITLEDGTTVVYTAGEYNKILTAIKRRDEFRAEGNKAAVVSKIKGRNVIRITDEELAEIIRKEKDADLLAGITTTSSAVTNTSSAVTNTAAAVTNSASVGSNTATAGNEGGNEESFSKTDIVYRVQLGAFKNKISTSVFNTSAGVLELKTGESVYRYVTKGFKTIEEAAAVRADLVIQGYSDAFVTAYKEGKRIPMSQTKATVDKAFKEDMNEDKIFSSVDKSLVAFKVQLGGLKKQFQEKIMDERVKDINDIEKQATSSGMIRYTTGKFSDMAAAEKYRKELEDKGFTDAFIIATFKGDIISIQEALELKK